MHGHVALQNLDVKFSVEQRRAGAVGPLVGELAIVFSKVARPDFLALEYKGGEIARAVEEKHQRPVRGRRGRREIAVPVLAETLRDFVVPKFLARLAIKRHRAERLRLGVRGTDEHRVAPDDWRGGRRAG